MLPSEIKMVSHKGYRKNLFKGWKKIDELTINGDGYIVNFHRLSEITIDRMCDALNGWYNIWTKYMIEYEDSKGTLSIVVKKAEDADLVYASLINITPMEFEHEGIILPNQIARIKIESFKTCQEFYRRQT